MFGLSLTFIFQATFWSLLNAVHNAVCLKDQHRAGYPSGSILYSLNPTRIREKFKAVSLVFVLFNADRISPMGNF